MAEQVNAMTTKDMVGKVYNVDVKVTYDENNDRVQAVKRTGIIHSGPSNGSYVLLTGKSGKSA